MIKVTRKTPQKLPPILQVEVSGPHSTLYATRMSGTTPVQGKDFRICVGAYYVYFSTVDMIEFAENLLQMAKSGDE